MISLDTETTGLDFWHGTKPFIITIAYEDNNVDCWEWSVDPLTRQPKVSQDDVAEIQEVLDGADVIAMHNSKFDVRALSTIGVKVDWPKVYDTLLAAHQINSSTPHDLTYCCLTYLWHDVRKQDQACKTVVEKCRRFCRKLLPEWRIAKTDEPDMPSAKGTVWKYDLWLPRALRKGLKRDKLLRPLFDTTGLPEQWWGITAKYANMDSQSTLALYHVFEKELKDRGQWKIYLQRMKDLPAIYEMEEVGVTLNRKRLDEKIIEYNQQSEKSANTCTVIAKSYDYDLELPKSGNNGSLNKLLFGGEEDCPKCEGEEPRDIDKLCNRCFGAGVVTVPGPMQMPVVKVSKKTGKPSLDKEVMAYYLETLKPRSKQGLFIKNLMDKRKRDTAVNYMEGYRRFMLPLDGPSREWFVLHPSVNPMGTTTLRSSSKNPNEQNISKQEGFNLRYVFGPAPGREWWSLDYNNLELRIPAYECQEPAMLELFEDPNSPPFFGSYHLLIFSILYPDKFDKFGAQVKERYKSSLYQWTKNGNFAELYGAIDTGDGKSTADRAFHYPGAQAIVSKRLKKKAALNQYWIDFANRNGYVETMPDKTVDPHNGYRLYPKASKSHGGSRISPTIPLNYRVQGTACWVKRQGMLKCWEELKKPEYKGQYHIIMDVHDELDFDFPYKKNKGNLPVVRRMKQLMESCGDDIGVPLTVGIDYHPNNWSKAEYSE